MSWRSSHSHPLGHGLLCVTPTEQRVCKKDHVASKSWNIYYLTLYWKKKKEKEKTIPYLLSFKDEKIKPKETKDIRIIQLAFGRKWSESESEVTQWVLFVTPWTVAYEAPPSMGFSRQGCWSGLPFPSPGDLPDWGIKPWSPALQADALPSEPETALKLSHLNPI